MTVGQHKTNLNYFTEISLIFDIILWHPDAPVSSSHSFYNCHKQQQHIRELPVNLCVIQTHTVVVLTSCDQSVDSCCHCTLNNLHRQVNLHYTLGTRLHVSLRLLSTAGNTQYVCQLHKTSICVPIIVVPISCLPFIVISHSTFATSFCRTSLWVHLRSQGRPNIAATFLDSETWRKISFQKHPSVSKLWRCWNPCHSPWQQLPFVLLQTSRKFIKKLTNV